MSKGSKPRPFEVPIEEFTASWDRIFSKKPRDKVEEPKVFIIEEPRAYKTPEEIREIAEMAFDAVYRDRLEYFNHTPKGDRNGSK